MSVVVAALDCTVVDRSRGSTRQCCRSQFVDAAVTGGAASVHGGDRASRDAP